MSSALISSQTHPSHTFYGFLNKKSKFRKQWKKRFFEIKDGLMKYYTTSTGKCGENNQIGNGLRGIFDLTGAKIQPILLDDPCRISIITPQDRTTEIVLEAESVEEREKVIAALECGISNKNTFALANASRLPEIVDWYYQRQSIFADKMTILEREHMFQIQYQCTNDAYPSSRSTSTNSAITTLATPPSTLSSYGSAVLANSQSPAVTQLSSSSHNQPDSQTSNVSIQTMSTVVKILANKDHTGLLFRVESPISQGKSGKRPPMSKLEALIDGRVLLFRDIEKLSKFRPDDFYPNHDHTRDRGISTGSEVGNDIDIRSNSVLSSASTVNNNRAMSDHSGLERLFHKDEYDISISTKEDTLQLRRHNSHMYPSPTELEEFQTWYEALEYAISFVAIPPPSSTIRHMIQSTTSYPSDSANANTTRNSSSSAAIHYGFYSMNSGLIFSCAGDVAIILKSFDHLQRQYPSIHQFTSLCTDILKLIPDVKTNKETIANFGERLEDIVRVLGDQSNGVFWMKYSPSDNAIIDQQLSLLCDALKDFKEYLAPLAMSGWMSAILSHQNISKVLKYPRFKTFQSKIASKKRMLKSSKGVSTNSSAISSYSNEKCILRQVFESVDTTLVAICNHLLTHYGDETWIFKKKEYDMVIDIQQTIDVLGGLTVISNEQAKIKALARLIQSDYSDVENEIILILRHGTVGRGKDERKGCIARYFCCFGGSQGENTSGLKTALLSEDENYDQELNPKSSRSPPSVRWGDEIDIPETKESPLNDVYKPRDSSVVSTDGVSLRPIPNSIK